MWVDKTHTVTISDVLDDHIFHQSRLTHTGFTDNVHVTTTIISFYTKRHFSIAEVGFSEKVNVSIGHSCSIKLLA